MNNEIKAKYNAFWKHDFDERAVLNIEVPSPASHTEYPENTADRWENTTWRKEAFSRYMNNTKYLAEGFPHYWINLGPGALAAMLGCEYTYFPYTVWFGKNPMIKEWSDMDKVKLLPENPMNKLILDMTKEFCKTSKDSYVVCITDLGGVMDILDSFRGTEQLMYDMVDEPDKVLSAIEKIDNFWEEAFTQSYKILEKANKCMSAWIPIWCSKRWYPLQCDFSAMISPDDFKKFVMPSLVRSANFLDHSIYHLDGMGELPHVDMLLSIDRLDGIQWVPGAGKPALADDQWFPLYEKIQAKGKCLVLFGVDSPSDCLYLLKNLSHKGLFISGCFKSTEEAEEVICKAKEYAK